MQAAGDKRQAAAPELPQADSTANHFSLGGHKGGLLYYRIKSPQHTLAKKIQPHSKQSQLSPYSIHTHN